ncbi:T9SS type A sorting domain-containing protein [Hymenobacter actinosclerus]|uniref:Por secretion system C-terminal sorting domain-containing protein n=1 Tax=Hymenobacter actinosclerus TaxID=82805 RepID=A0A1I0F2R8_9BACT|nr:T9SS type A sorting domain-containing protein [Hymenobacter actinosclerus]SET51498.1 Por secretion system C-terminal sorting domain-containing protein [Hymenobacter actinosclerus]
MKLNFYPLRGRAARTRPLWHLLTAWVALMLCSTAAWAQFPRIESFKNATTEGVGFRLGGNPNPAVLTAAAGGTDANGAGYLRLTNNTTDQAGFAIDRASFRAPEGFSISFEFFSYGGTGADGFSVFLVDADKTSAEAFTSGASGGSLGYAQKTVSPISDGVPNGYIGIGIDEFGNYANPTEGRVDGPGSRPDAVSLRGPGNGRGTTDYPFVAGGTTLPFSLDVATVRAQQGSDDFRRAYIYVLPQPDGTYQITVRIQNGNAVTTAIERVRVATPPPRLRIGFAGSTGGSTNFHEIRNLAIIQAPVANDDVAATVYGVPVTLNILSNDVAQGSNLAPATVDLDPTTTAIDNAFTVAGKGTFMRDANGVVTFTPVATFAGVVTIPYTVASVVGDLSNPANITIIVKGADVATSVSGPTAASPGSAVLYTINTSNLGTETSNNIVPSIQLPANLTGVVVSGGSYNAASGLVTFATVASLAPGAPSIVNTVRFTAPANGSVTGTAGVTLSTPDPVLSNNTAAITTVVQGNANAATACATPGKDGPGALTSTSGAPNTYFPGSATTVMSATSITVGAAVGATPIAKGDLVMIIQMQGANLNTANDANYGSVTAATFTAGFYEYAIATNSVPATGGTLTVDRALTRIYERANYTDGTNPTGQRRFQVVRVPQYSSLTVTGTVTGAAWNGETGGILALDVAGQTTFAGNGRLDMTGKGFRGGGARQYTGVSSGYRTDDYRNIASTTTTGVHGAKGEGWAGTPRFVWNGTGVTDTGVEGYRNGSVGRGAPGNAGGGGTDNQLPTNTGNAGGGGGGNAAAGGLGGFNRNAGSGTQALGGASVASSISRWFMGGGGGAGSTEQAGTQSSGGVGGGIVVLRTSLLSGTGQLRADGSGAPTAGLATNYTNGGGGGGAGGTVVLLASNTSGFANMTLSAAGGDGGNARTGKNDDDYGPGGGGGGGFVFANSSSGTRDVSGGANGLTERGRAADANSATAGTGGTAVVNATEPAVLISAANGCLPSLSVALATSTPNVQRTGDASSSVNPATYTLTVSNTGGQADNVAILVALANNIFGYDATFTPVITLQRADGSTSSLSTTRPGAGVSQAQFGDASLSIPAGATLSITFRATIAAAAQNSFAYQANATVTYNDPFRTTATGTITPGGNYANTAALGAAGGSNYSASSSTNEDVTITKPLPVTLTAFNAIASGHDAVLTWATATELNNDRFELERSFDGATFETIGSQQGQGTAAVATNYRYVDAGAARLTAKLLYYRLRQVDTDGTSTYSKVRTVQFERRKATAGLYPNPQQGRFTLDLLDLPAGSYQVDILDLTGRQVLRTQLSGGQEHSVLVPTLPQGSYIVRVSGQTVNITLPMTRN